MWWRRIRRTIGVSAAVLVLGITALYCGVSWWLPKAIVSTRNTHLDIDPADEPMDLPFDVTHRLRVDVGPPEANLSVWVLDPVEPPQGTIVLLHGINDRKTSLLGTAAWCTSRGYRAVLLDLRASGWSTGRYGSFGVHEGRDLVQVLDALEAQALLTAQVGVLGFSYGGAVALQAAAGDSRIDAVITVATFTSMREIVPLYVRRMLPMDVLLDDGTIQRAVNDAGRLAGFDPDEADSRRAIAGLSIPVLLIHGLADEHVPSAMAEQLHAAKTDSELWLVPDAAHMSIMHGPNAGGVVERALDFFDEALTSPTMRIDDGAATTPAR